jgi:hypothetical protein
MSDRSKNTSSSTVFPNHQAVARQREPYTLVLIMALFVGGAIFCPALIAPILWTAVTEFGQRPTLTYRQCGAVREDNNRLACYESVLRQISLRSAKDVGRMTLGEILTKQPEQVGPQ